MIANIATNTTIASSTIDTGTIAAGDARLTSVVRLASDARLTDSATRVVDVNLFEITDTSTRVTEVDDPDAIAVGV